MSARRPDRILLGQTVQSAAPFVLLALLVFIAYWNSLQNGFPGDDRAIIENNPLIVKPGNLGRLLTSDYWAGYYDPDGSVQFKTGRYRPLLLLTFFVQYRWSGSNPVPYHLVNVILHLGVTWLVYLTALRVGLDRLAALVGAILFAVHPIHTEPVDMLVGRAELLMALGVLASLVWAIQGRHWLSLAAFTGALLSKEQAVVLPVLLALYQFCNEPRTRGKTLWDSLKAKIPQYAGFGIVLGLYLVARKGVLGRVVMSPSPFVLDPISYLPWPSWLLTTIKSAGLYIRLCMWPVPLSADYSYNSLPAATSVMDPGVLFALVSWGALLGLAGWSIVRNTRRTAFLVGFSVLTFAPSANLLFPVGTPMAERLFYLPSAGLCLLVALGLESLVSWSSRHPTVLSTTRLMRSGLALVLVSLLTFSYVIHTKERNGDWSNTESIILSVLKAYPDNVNAHRWAGNEALDHHEWESALRHYEEALRIYPDLEAVEPEVAAHIGLALMETGHSLEGLGKIEQAAFQEPNLAMMQWLLGVAYVKTQRYSEAEWAFRKAIDLKPDDEKSHFGLSYMYLEHSQYEPALREAEAAIKSRPDFMEPHYVRARALESLGRDRDAIEEYGRVLRFPQAPTDVAQRFYRLRSAHPDPE